MLARMNDPRKRWVFVYQVNLERESCGRLDCSVEGQGSIFPNFGARYHIAPAAMMSRYGEDNS